jgi:hypothetical protein
MPARRFNPQSKRQHVDRLAVLRAIKHLRITQRLGVFGQSASTAACCLTCSLVWSSSPSFMPNICWRKVGGVGIVTPLHAFVRRNPGQLFGDLNCLVDTAIFIDQPFFFSLLASQTRPWPIESM